LHGKHRFVSIAEALNPPDFAEGAVSRIRSPPLLALAVALLASSGALAYVLEHDAVGQGGDFALTESDGGVTLKGTLQPFLAKAANAHEAAAWARVTRDLDNFTYTFEPAGGAEADLVILVTSPTPGPTADTVIITTATVLLQVPHPDGSGRRLVVVEAANLESPILFG